MHVKHLESCTFGLRTGSQHGGRAHLQLFIVTKLGLHYGLPLTLQPFYDENAWLLPSSLATICDHMQGVQSGALTVLQICERTTCLKTNGVMCCGQVAQQLHRTPSAEK